MEADLKSACDGYLQSAFTESDKAEIKALVEAKEYDDLRRRMIPRIAFGTSGLRGKMEAGYARMNDLTVFQASIGLRDYVLEKVSDAKSRGIVIGHDHRHNSLRFAQIVEAVFAPVMQVYVFGTLVHTPLVPFSVKTLKAACGVMITASHNPKQDNGYKVYGENSCAIIPPHDHGISEAIMKAVAADPVAKPQFGVTSDRVRNVYEAMTKAYFSRIFETLAKTQRQLSPPPAEPSSPAKDFRFCYTPMHGVGLIYARVAMSASPSASAKSEMVVVAEQALPDPDFSTVEFPNPEESGALDLAMQTADGEGISLVVATDPDADRLGAAEKVDGKWHILTGNQIGVLLASTLIASSDPSTKRALLSSAVSSKMLQSMAAAEGIHWEETLTGFKWLGNRALQLEQQQGYDVLLAYEEALGFMPLDIVYDKDGVLAMTLLLAAAQRLYAQDSSLSEELARLHARYGHFASANSYFLIHDPALLKRVMNSLRTTTTTTSSSSSSPPHGADRGSLRGRDDRGYPTTLGRRRVVRVRDLTRPYDSSTRDGQPTLPTSNASEMLTFWFTPYVGGGGDGSNDGENDTDKGDGEFESASMTIRGSGTEPKLKYYIEAKSSTGTGSAERAARAIERDLIAEWFGAFQLQRP